MTRIMISDNSSLSKMIISYILNSYHSPNKKAKTNSGKKITVYISTPKNRINVFLFNISRGKTFLLII